MANRSTLTPRRHLHSLKRCVYCGARHNIYTALFYATQAWAAVCEDPVSCQARSHRRKVDAA